MSEKTLPPNYPNRITLVLGAACSGKTDRAIGIYQAAPLHTLFVVATQTQQERLLPRFVPHFQSHLLNFSDFLKNLLEDAPHVELIGRSVQHLLLADMVQRSLRHDDVLGPMRQHRGFVAALADRIREWKLAELTPAHLISISSEAENARGTSVEAKKIEELARLYQAYEEFLQEHGFQDGEGWLKLAKDRCLQKSVPFLENYQTLIFDGFFSLSSLHLSLLEAIAAQQPHLQLVLTLFYDPSRPHLFSSMQRVLERLKRSFSCREELLPLPDPPSSIAQLLSARLFHTTPSQFTSTTSLQPIWLFDAPDAYMEAEMVARAFQNLYKTGNYKWSDFAVVVRGTTSLTPILTSVFERYNIPLGVYQTETVADNPLVRTLFSYLTILCNNWPREEVLAFFRSSYTMPSHQDAEELRLLAREKRVRAGFGEWRMALQALPQSSPSAQWFQRMAECASKLDHPLPPQVLAEEIVELISVFELEKAIELGEPTRQERDKEALRLAVETLHSLAEMLGLTGREQVDLPTFVEALQTVWQNTLVPTAAKEDEVWISEPYDVHQRKPRVVAIMGMLERAFPRRIVEDPFLPDAIRKLIWNQAGVWLPSHLEQMDEERLLFYLAATAPTERLILSYPRSSGEADALPSFYIDEIREATAPETQKLLSATSRRLSDVAPRLDDTASERDRILHHCAQLFDPVLSQEERDKAFQQIKAMCGQDPETTIVVRHAIASRFLPPLPSVEASSLQSWLKQKSIKCSIGELETYIQCPFRHLLQYRLKIRPNPDENLPLLQEQLLHNILRSALSEKTCNNLTTLRTALRQSLDREMEQLIVDIPLHKERLLRRTLSQMLDRIAEREQAYKDLLPLRPHYFHLYFGTENPDPNSSIASPNPLLIEIPEEKEPVMLYGEIDRVDKEENDLAFLIDYTTFAPPKWKDVQQGRSLRLLFSLMALEHLFGIKAAGICIDSALREGRPRLFRIDLVSQSKFRPILNREKGDEVLPINQDQYLGMRQNALSTVQRAVKAMRAGDVRALPGLHCQNCPYSDICRTTLQGHDGEPLDERPS